MRARSLVVVAAPLALSACFIDFDIPGEARFSCRTDDDCLTDASCKSFSFDGADRRCVPDSAEDKPPQVSNGAFTQIVEAGRARVTVTFDTDEPLAVDPRVTLGDTA
jgi:hypothetical protein